MTSASAWDSAVLAGWPADRLAHLALFYRDTAEYRSTCVSFILAGLAAGELVVVAVPGPNLDRLQAGLTRHHADLAGQVRWLDMTDVGRNPGRILPTFLQIVAGQHPRQRLRLIGEPIWAGRSSVEYPACVQHEALINVAFHGQAATVLCPYDVTTLDDLVISDAALTHPVLVSADGLRTSGEFAPERAVQIYNQPLDEPAFAEMMTVRAADIPLARHLAVRWAGSAGLAVHRYADVAIAVTELVTNSIEHGGGKATLRLWTTSTDLVCEVVDSGQVDDLLTGRMPVSVHQPRGRGLLLVNYSADLVRMYVGESGTTIRAYFRR
jgi:anti-sigma regulatory factor (Ser/Thr protein kinase)